MRPPQINPTVDLSSMNTTLPAVFSTEKLCYNAFTMNMGVFLNE